MFLVRTLPKASLPWISAMLLAAAPSWAATPVSSSISLESFAQYCNPEDCLGAVNIQQTSVDSDSQFVTLNPLLASVNASAGNQLVGPGATATLSMNASFQSVSTGSIGFSGQTGTRRPDFQGGESCAAHNNTSDGFEYTFVASADGFLTIDYEIGCSPTAGTLVLGGVEIYVDSVFYGTAAVSTSNPNASGTTTRPIQNGATHSFRVKPTLAMIGGNCSPPPNMVWGCSGSASWSFDAAPSVPSPAGSWQGALLIVGLLSGVGLVSLKQTA